MICSPRPCLLVLPWNPAKHVFVFNVFLLLEWNYKCLQSCCVSGVLRKLIWMLHARKLKVHVNSFVIHGTQQNLMQTLFSLSSYQSGSVFCKQPLADQLLAGMMFLDQRCFGIFNPTSKFINDVSFLMSSTRISKAPCSGLPRDSRR